MFRRSALWAAVPWLSPLPRLWRHVADVGGRYFRFWQINALSARRDPYHAFVFDASLFAFAYETPAFELALLLERFTTRADDDWGNLPFRGAVAAGGLRPRVSFNTIRSSSFVYAMASASKKAATFSVYSISPMKARRDPPHAYELDASLLAFAYETPALESAL